MNVFTIVVSFIILELKCNLMMLFLFILGLVIVGTFSIPSIMIMEYYILPRIKGTRFHKWWRKNIVGEDMDP